MSKRILCLLALCPLAIACKQTWTEPNLDHCTYNGGDHYCADRFPDKPLCNAGDEVCSVGDRYGCVVEVTPECHAPCGEPGDRSCVDGGSSGGSGSGSGSGGSGDTAATEGGSSSDGGMTSTTGEMPCMGDGDCTDAAAPFCDPAGVCVDCGELVDGNGACAGADPGLPVCDGGVCVACTEQDPGACGGQTPVCGEDNLCRACAEHSECPGTACHLDGGQVGACFDLGEVTEVANAVELNAALAGLGATGRAVLVLGPGTYATSIDVGAAAEVAILAPGSATIAGDGGLNAVELIGTSITYLQGVDVANIAGNGISCSATSVWLDDSQVRNNAQAGMTVSSGCAAHLRRTVVRANNSGGIVAASSPVHLVTSAVGENVDTQDIAGIQITNGELRVRYSTIVANLAVTGGADSIQCFGSPTIDVRNSIVMASGGNSINGCAAVGWANNALDTNLDAVNSSMVYNAGWFDPAEGDYHLTTAGATDLAGLANWQPGDPLTDVDGQPIPTEVLSSPGYDQP